MRGFKQTRGQNNKVPRDIVLGRNTCGSHLRCDSCKTMEWCCVHSIGLGIHVDMPKEREDDVGDYIHSVGNYPPLDSLREQAAQALQPDRGAGLQPQPPDTPYGAGRDREGTVTITIENHLERMGNQIVQTRPTTMRRTFTPYNRGDRRRRRSGPKSLSPRKSKEALEFRRKFLES